MPEPPVQVLRSAAVGASGQSRQHGRALDRLGEGASADQHQGDAAAEQTDPEGGEGFTDREGQTEGPGGDGEHLRRGDRRGQQEGHDRRQRDPGAQERGYQGEDGDAADRCQCPDQRDQQDHAQLLALEQRGDDAHGPGGHDRGGQQHAGDNPRRDDHQAMQGEASGLQQLRAEQQHCGEPGGGDQKPRDRLPDGDSRNQAGHGPAPFLVVCDRHFGRN